MRATGPNMSRALPLPKHRRPQENIPQTFAERERLRRLVAEHIEQARPTPPLSIDELRVICERLISQHAIDLKYLHFLAILVNNEVWREALAAVPYDRRLLLLPKCLRVEDKCPASFDELGLVCKLCGLCSIQELQSEAERLGYAVLVAEGSALVMALVQTGKIDAIVGVSCLPVLEKAFPYIESAAIPSLAIPLLQKDCRDSSVDLDWVWDAINLSSDDQTRRLNLDQLRRHVDAWFAPESLDAILGRPHTQTERIARDWLAKSGKRWRPFLAVCAYKAAHADADAALPESLRHVAVGVECFHKASLVHDDIEDEDELRYGEKTLHEQHGVPIALNVGDLLLGDGYRLLADCDAPAGIRAELARIAADGHRTLSIGQGEELCWARLPRPLSSAQVLEIFRQKTAPAFEVALRLGAALAGEGDQLAEPLRQYSEALGIAYQIRDDLEDLAADETEAPKANRPALPLAVAYEQSSVETKAIFEQAWHSTQPLGADIRDALRKAGVAEHCAELLESYKQQAIRSLVGIDAPSLKGLLRRVVGKIFSVEIKGWCSECQTSNAPGGEGGAPAPG